MKKAIIIGATSGIGKALAQLLADNNYKVGITGRRTALLEEIKIQNPEVFEIFTLDVTDTAHGITKLENLVEKLGGMDLLIFSSGTGDINNNLDFIIEKKSIETNVSGFTLIVGWAFNFFEKQKHGHMVGISSIAGLRGSRHCPAYNATKAYQINYLEALRQKATSLKLPVYVTDIRPGFVDTDMAKGDGLFWVTPVQKAARQIFNAIKKKKKTVYVSKRWCLIAYLLKCLPDNIYKRF